MWIYSVDSLMKGTYLLLNKGTFLCQTPVPYLWMLWGLQSFSVLCSIGNSTGTSYFQTSESLVWKVYRAWNAANASPAGPRCTSSEPDPGRTCSWPGLLKLPGNKPTASCSRSRPSCRVWFLRLGGRVVTVAVRRLYTMGGRSPWGEKRCRTWGWRRWNCWSRCKGCHCIQRMSCSENNREEIHLLISSLLSEQVCIIWINRFSVGLIF